MWTLCAEKKGRKNQIQCTMFALDLRAPIAYYYPRVPQFLWCIYPSVMYCDFEESKTEDSRTIARQLLFQQGVEHMATV